MRTTTTRGDHKSIRNHALNTRVFRTRSDDRRAAGNPTATFDTSMGTFSAELYLDRVPRTASNFIDLAKSGFYNGLHFHRVIDGFMNQVWLSTHETRRHLAQGPAVHRMVPL